MKSTTENNILLFFDELRHLSVAKCEKKINLQWAFCQDGAVCKTC